MKRLYIVVEGQTEEEFVKSILAPHLLEQGIFCVTPVAIHRGRGARGGMVSYEPLKGDILRLLRDGDAPIVSTLIDFFRCPDTPGKEVWNKASNHQQEVELREQEIGRDIGGRHFIPYIQLHEFEALLFSSDVGFKKELSPKEAGKLSKIVEDYPNPEEINSSPEGAPSKRILAVVSYYDKVFHGNLIAGAIGIKVILERCPRFRAWVERLVSACSSE
jgi:hypothetical protein